MQQYFIQTDSNPNALVSFDKEQQKHMKNVLRMREGTIVKVVDTKETPYLAKILYHDDIPYGEIIERMQPNQEDIKVTLIQGMIKGDRWDMCIQKACEFGVDTIVPLISKRTVVKTNDKMDKKLARYNKIALEACEQSKRDHLVKVEEVISMKDINIYKSELNLIAYEDADSVSQNIKDVLLEHKDVKSVSIVIGSEGGFEKEECELAKAQGFIVVSLGKRIYRAESAAIASIHTTLLVLE